MWSFSKVPAVVILGAYHLNLVQRHMQFPAWATSSQIPSCSSLKRSPSYIWMLAFSRQARTFPSLCAAKWLSVLKSQIFKEMESNQNEMVYSIPQVSKDEMPLLFLFCAHYSPTYKTASLVPFFATLAWLLPLACIYRLKSVSHQRPGLSLTPFKVFSSFLESRTVICLSVLF